MTVPANAISRYDLVTEILGERFSSRTSGLRALHVAYQGVWSSADWTFKQVLLESWTADAQAPTMPAAFAEATAIYTSTGDPLEELTRDDFEACYAGSTSTGTPAEFTVVNRQIYLGPTPNGDTLLLSYRRRLSHLEADLLTVTAGAMDEDDDYPLWDDHHGVLIPRGQAIMLKLVGDPAWQVVEDEYQAQLADMVADLGGAIPRGAQWGSEAT